ncbi:MAG: hypothetical protein EXQ52_09810 [Bryobacterales bacterium]|nr:hypothetical protein [Bryobacterales bacterium]
MRLLAKAISIIMAWGQPGLFVVAFLDSAGIPLPQGVDALVLLLSAKNPGLAYVYALIAMVGSVAGCLVLFYLARRGGKPFLDRIVPPEKTRRFREWYHDYGLVATFITTVVPVIPLPTKVFIASSGALGTRAVPFVLVVTAARGVRYLGEAYLGAQMGEHAWEWLRAHGRELGLAALGLFVLLYVLVKLGDRYVNSRSSVQG